ncbi:MAG: hypothetical protein ACRD3C_19495 [Vicinamibacterales bacterium]
MAHFDGATGSGDDDAALAVAWTDDEGRGVLAALRRWEPPFSPVSVVTEASALLSRYMVTELQIDRFAPGLFADVFAAHGGLTCQLAERDTSQMFLELLAYVNADRVRLLDDAVLLGQLRGLERRTRAGGRDAVGHRSRGHDDLAAACAGALVLAASEDADGPPLTLVGSATYREWEARHCVRTRADDATRKEREQLLPLVEALGRAIESNDDSATAAAWAGIEGHAAAIEVNDPAAGRRLRAVIAEVEQVVEEHSSASV